MKNIETWEQFLQRRAKSAKPEVDWVKRRDEWLAHLKELFSKVEGWMKPYVEAGQMKLRTDGFVSITEDYIGTYMAPTVLIYIGDDLVSLTPKGALIIGSRGRVDMRGTKREVMLVLLEDKGWPFAFRNGGPKLHYEDLSEDSFKEIVQSLV
jgi:hypothetical protein